MAAFLNKDGRLNDFAAIKPKGKARNWAVHKASLGLLLARRIRPKTDAHDSYCRERAEHLAEKGYYLAAGKIAAKGAGYSKNGEDEAKLRRLAKDYFMLAKKPFLAYDQLLLGLKLENDRFDSEYDRFRREADALKRSSPEEALRSYYKALEACNSFLKKGEPLMAQPRTKKAVLRAFESAYSRMSSAYSSIAFCFNKCGEEGLADEYRGKAKAVIVKSIDCAIEITTMELQALEPQMKKMKL